MKEKEKYTKSQFKKEFAKLMESTTILSSLSDAEIVKQYSNIFSFVERYIPSKLFRFRKCNIDSIISFEQGTIPVCSASMFPDKYDSTVYYNHKTFEGKIRNAYDQFVSNQFQLIKTNPPQSPSNQFVAKAMEILASSQSLEEALNVFWKELEPLLIEWEKHVTLQEQWPRTNKTTKVACFTETVKSKFMWDTYADGYKGFALEYDFRSWRALTTNNNHAVMLCPVIYSTQKMDATDMIDKLSVQNYLEYYHAPEALKQLYASQYPIDRLYFQKIYLYKDKNEYSHEKEWRLLDVEPLNTVEASEDFFSLKDAHCLKAIYYGPEMESRYKIHLRNIAKQKGLKEYNVVLDTNSRKYDLKVIRVS